MNELNKKRANNMKEQFNKPGVKMLLITTVAIAGAAIILGVAQTGGQEAVQSDGQARAVRATGVTAAPGTVTDATYQAAIRDQNKEGAAQAAQQGGTFVPTIQGTAQVQPIDPFTNQPRAPQAQAELPGGAVPVVSGVQRVNNPQTSQPTNPGTAQMVKNSERFRAIEKQFLGYMQGWVAPTAASEFNFNGQASESPTSNVANAGGGSSGVGVASGVGPVNGVPAPAPGAKYLRAGTVVPAMVLSCVNSQEPGPVLAQIFSGPLAGSRVIGGFTTSQDSQSLILQFNTISMPGETQSYSIDAYAVEEDLSIGMATDVNNHYFRRYVLRLAAGFVAGYGQAVASQNTTTTVTDGGAIVISRGGLDSGQINRQALGQAAADVSQDVDQFSNIAPTVKLCGKDGAGVPIGLLFMSDF